MTLTVLTNIIYWIVAALIFGLLIGDIGKIGPFVIITSLIIMMTVSLIGLNLKKRDVTEKKKELALALICCYVVATGATLAVGLFFDQTLWSGWVMIASVPCAVSVVSAALIMKGDMKLALVSVTAIYLVALVFTPIFTKVLIGDAVDPLEILKYVLLFIMIPLLLSIPLKKVKLSADLRNVIINICFFFLVAVAIGANKELFFEDPVLVAWVALACVIRLVGVFAIMEFILRKFKVERNSRIVFVVISVWKNSALAMTLTLLLIPEAEAAIPAAILLPLETIWFMFMIGYYRKRQPPTTVNTSPSING